MTSDQDTANLPDGWYYDDYDLGTWLVVVGDRIIKDGVATRDEAIRIYRGEALRRLVEQSERLGLEY